MIYPILNTEGWLLRRIPRKLWLAVLLVGSLIIAQYHMTNLWVVPPFSKRINQLGQTSSSHNQLLSKLQLDDRVLAKCGHKAVKDIALQVAQHLMGDLCGTSSSNFNNASVLQPLYIITPTYPRPEQVAELTRLAQTLMHVRNLLWLVVEDAHVKTPQVTVMLKKTRLRTEHLLGPMPAQYKKKSSMPQGVSNRIRAMQWIRANATRGVFYFADDDNSYDIELFEEMRSTKKVSMWPVGLINTYSLSTPIVRNGNFSGFFDGWLGGRKFPVDMAGFAVNVEFFLQRPKARMPYQAGYEEEGFLNSLRPFEPNQIELKANNCTKILVWHTQSKTKEPTKAIDLEKYNDTNLVHLSKLIF